MGRGGAASVLFVRTVRQSSCTRTHERQSTRTREHQSTRASERDECCQSWSGKPPPCPVGGCEGATVSTTRCAGPVERDLRILGGRCVKDAAARHHRGASTVAEVAMPSRGTDATRRRTEARNVAPRVFLDLRRRVDHFDRFVAPVGRSIASIALFRCANHQGDRSSGSLAGLLVHRATCRRYHDCPRASLAGSCFSSPAFLQSVGRSSLFTVLVGRRASQGFGLGSYPARLGCNRLDPSRRSARWHASQGSVQKHCIRAAGWSRRDRIGVVANRCIRAAGWSRRDRIGVEANRCIRAAGRRRRISHAWLVRSWHWCRLAHEPGSDPPPGSRRGRLRRSAAAEARTGGRRPPCDRLRLRRRSGRSGRAGLSSKS